MSFTKPYVCMQTHSTCYTKTTHPMQIKGILWHSTGANNPYIKRYVQPYEGDPNYDEAIALLGKNTSHNDWNHIYREAGLNAWIGKFADGHVGTVQSMPWDYKPWGCGSAYKGGPSCNNGWIQFEICEDALTDKNYAQQVWDEAIDFSVYLCKMFNLDPMGVATCSGVTVPVITCHNDAAKLGVACNHSDINHWFPKLLGKDMNNARLEIQAKMGITPTPIPQPTPTPTPTPQPTPLPSGTPDPYADYSKAFWDFFRILGMPEYGVAGLIGNIACESAIRPNNLQNSYEKKLGMDDKQYTAAVDNGSYKNFVNDSAGYGLAQWTYSSRKQGLLNLAKQCNMSICDINLQLTYLTNELQSKYIGVWNGLMSATSILQASNIVLLGFEKPADQSSANQQRRAGYCQNYYNQFTGSSITTTFPIVATQTSTSAPINTTPQTTEPISTTITPYKIKVTSKQLNYRKGPGVNYPIAGVIKDQGVYTIVDEEKGWGLLKSYQKNRDGWISLQYTKKV